MANIYNEPDSTNVKITLKNNIYSYLVSNIGKVKICLITDQVKFGYSDLYGNLKKCLTDASGATVTPEKCVFISDSAGSASHSTSFVYDDDKLGVNIASPQGKAHFHEPTTGNCLIQITNSTTGSSDEYDGMTVGIVGDDNVIRTTYMRPVKIQSEDTVTPGTFRDIVTFKDEGTRYVILDADLYINDLPAESDPATTVLVPDSDGCVSTRTVAQIRSDIGAASSDDIASVVSALAGKQPLDSDLTAIAALTHTDKKVIISDGTNWQSRLLVAADISDITDTINAAFGSEWTEYDISAANNQFNPTDLYTHAMYKIDGKKVSINFCVKADGGSSIFYLPLPNDYKNIYKPHGINEYYQWAGVAKALVLTKDGIDRYPSLTICKVGYNGSDSTNYGTNVPYIKVGDNGCQIDHEEWNSEMYGVTGIVDYYIV